MARIIGIDLGTTNSLAAVWEAGESRLIPNTFGEYLTPSVVSMDESGEIYVGKVAKERLITHAGSTVSVFKRFMGTAKTYQLGGRSYRPEELSAFILRRLKEDAEAYLGEPVEEAVISVPAYFNDMARKATRDAGRLAGLRVDKIINEPSAAALACQSVKKEEEAVYLVFDFGGGTLDVSLVDCFENIIEIKAVSGDNRLGGSDFDTAIAQAFCRRNDLSFHELEGDLKAAILDSAEQVKRSLSEAETAVMRVRLEEFQGTMELSRKDLIEIAGNIFKRMSGPVKRVLSDGGVSSEQLEMAVLVGGSCKMPVVQQYLQYLLKDVRLTTAHPDYMIALGAGVYAGIKERSGDVRDLLLTDICPFSLGIAVVNDGDPANPLMAVMIERNSPLPISIEKPFYTVRDNQTRIEVEVFQGEELYTKNNLRLGTTDVAIPPAPMGKGTVYVRFTYDINGLLVVDIKEKDSGERKQLVLLNNQNSMTSEELEVRLKELEKLKIHPRDDEENKLLLARGEKLFKQSVNQQRNEIEERIRYYEHLLEEQDTYKLFKWRKHLKGYFDQVEKFYQQLDEPWEHLQKFSDWYEKGNDDQEALDDYLAWSEQKYLS